MHQSIVTMRYPNVRPLYALAARRTGGTRGADARGRSAGDHEDGASLLGGLALRTFASDAPSTRSGTGRLPVARSSRS